MSGWQPEQYDPRRQQQPDVSQFNRTGLPPWNGPQQSPPQGYYQPQQPPFQPQYAPGPAQQHRKPRKGLAFLGCGGLGALIVLITVIVSTSSSSAPSPATSRDQQVAAPAAGAAAAAPAKQTVTYEVTGSAADVTYGPTGSDLSASVPLDKTETIPSKAPLYYSVQAQLQGAGSVTCKIKVDGKVISQATATGGYQIAQCEIGQDPLSGNWQDDNKG